MFTPLAPPCSVQTGSALLWSDAVIDYARAVWSAENRMAYASGCTVAHWVGEDQCRVSPFQRGIFIIIIIIIIIIFTSLWFNWFSKEYVSHSPCTSYPLFCQKISD
jgi:hypothetical protein